MPSLSVFHAEPFMRRFHLVAAVLVVPAAACAHKPAPAAPQAPSVAPQTLPAEQQIALAVLPLPRDFRADATVLGFDANSKLVTLRQGTDHMICLVGDLKGDGFHPACYQDGMEPFMARGRELRGQGVKNVDSARFAEVKAGKLKVPAQAAALWAMDGPWSGVDAAAGTVTSAIKLRYSVYMPFATAASTGLPDQVLSTGPWLMDAGTPKAHIMFTMTM
jgi:hypothetical protein